jgi:hypothetical protein
MKNLLDLGHKFGADKRLRRTAQAQPGILGVDIKQNQLEFLTLTCKEKDQFAFSNMLCNFKEGV